MSMNKSFLSFSVGNCAVFQQRFELEEFESFSKLSGDSNPMHHDPEHAASSKFGQIIVPMHMTISPLSRIAGMIFPGVPSLYLGHQVRSISPVYYGDLLTYTARIKSINQAMRTIVIRVLICRGSEVVLDAEMNVMSQQESWGIDATAVDFSPLPECALVTGATGEIGTALAVNLARRGWNLLLLDRGVGPRRDELLKSLKPVLKQHQKLEFLDADLLDANQVSNLCEKIAARNDITALFHTASPSLDAAINDLVQVNYRVLQQLADAVSPAMLMRQQGVVCTIGTIATERVIAGLQDYAAAKTMAGQLLTSYDKKYANFGLRGLVILSGLVATRYSASIQGDSFMMAPEELADEVLTAALDERCGQAIVVEAGNRRGGALGFHANETLASMPQVGDTSVQGKTPKTNEVNLAGVEASTDSLDEKIANIVSRKLSLETTSQLFGGGLGITPGWDSLRHIEVVLELEAVFDINFRSDEVEKMFDYSALCSITRKKLA